jgi:hypothetical protein
VFVLHFSGRFLLTASLGGRRKPIYISLFTVLPHASIPVNYTSEFLEIIQANAGRFFRPLHINVRSL